MPKKEIKMKDELDRFYTKESIAIECINRLSKFTSQGDIFVEPSAGGGAFYKNLESPKFGYDLAPACDGVEKADWLETVPPHDCVIVGNPPFGTRNSLTKAFIKHSLQFAKCIAFILPASYRKETTQRVFPDSWMLVHNYDLPDNSFLLDDKPYHVPCVFQVWMKKELAKGLTDLRESSKIPITTKDFVFCKKDEADFFVFGASPSKIIEKELVLPTNRGYYIKQMVSGVRELFGVTDWKAKANSTVSGGVAWYSKQEIINIYEEHKNGN